MALSFGFLYFRYFIKFSKEFWSSDQILFTKETQTQNKLKLNATKENNHSNVVYVCFFFFHFKCYSLIASCKNAFKPPNDCVYPYWDYVFNCAAETRLGKSDAIYMEGIYKLSLNCINEAIEQNVHRYIEFSSGNMLSSEKKPIKEDCERKPWTKVAQQKARIEDELENRSNDLNYTILRLPLVYGIGDHKGLGIIHFWRNNNNFFWK